MMGEAEAWAISAGKAPPQNVERQSEMAIVAGIWHRRFSRHLGSPSECLLTILLLTWEPAAPATVVGCSSSRYYQHQQAACPLPLFTAVPASSDFVQLLTYFSNMVKCTSCHLAICLLWIRARFYKHPKISDWVILDRQNKGKA